MCRLCVSPLQHFPLSMCCWSWSWSNVPVSVGLTNSAALAMATQQNRPSHQRPSAFEGACVAGNSTENFISFRQRRKREGGTEREAERERHTENFLDFSSTFRIFSCGQVASAGSAAERDAQTKRGDRRGFGSKRTLQSSKCSFHNPIRARLTVVSFICVLCKFHTPAGESHLGVAGWRLAR